MFGKLVVAILLSQLFSQAVECQRKTVIKATKPPKKMPDFSSKYYREPFEPCKRFRKLNPVEEVRAQVYATKLFAVCGSSMFLKYVEKLEIPAFALHGIGELVCKMSNLGYAYVANDGTTTLKSSEQLQDVLTLFYRTIQAASKIDHVLKIQHREQTFRMSVQKMSPLLKMIADCAIFGTTSPQLIGDYQLHTIDYYLKILT